MQKSRIETATAALVAHVRAKLGPTATWVLFGGGYPGDIESALIDAVFSTRYSYNTTYGKGLAPKIAAWQCARVRGTAGPTASALSSEVANWGGTRPWAIANFTLHISGRGPSRRLKAEVVEEAALALTWHGFDHAQTVTAPRLSSFMDLLQSVDGIGLPTARYVAMLLGYQEVKPDIMIHRFIHDATGRWAKDNEAITMVKAAGQALGIPDVRNLDHAIWDFQRRI